ncbi:VWA domain-containing protein [Profundibacterium mesophilum]|uniref:TPR domain protein n=1 Tax=Profundibacterium mesophilum KAUST100406-0324 TaxID=1037889 RepID=A0A921TCB9_9RHOB|nr:VWA domain-containing protein [Profundibacterium mesophilum]KAF0674697.1 TPR domain protein [Profundibacterium mesophilum KAUST100406-0324]
MNALEFLRPAWLLALVPILLAAGAARRAPPGLGSWRDAIDPQLLAAMERFGRISAEHGAARLRAACAVAVLLAIALAGPSVTKREAAGFRNLDGTVFVLDASDAAVAAPGWRRLAVAGRIGTEGLGTRPAALVVFGGDAYVASDMSADHRALGQTMLLVGPQTIPDPGQRPELGLAAALRLLEDAQILAGDIVLLTDGGRLGGAAVSRLAEDIADRGARLSVVSLSASGAAAELAARGGGRQFDPVRPEALTAFLAQETRERLVALGIPLSLRTDLGPWLLLSALLPAGLLLRRSRT